jgi:hypothetical protein
MYMIKIILSHRALLKTPAFGAGKSLLWRMGVLVWRVDSRCPFYFHIVSFFIHGVRGFVLFCLIRSV